MYTLSTNEQRWLLIRNLDDAIDNAEELGLYGVEILKKLKSDYEQQFDKEDPTWRNGME